MMTCKQWFGKHWSLGPVGLHPLLQSLIHTHTNTHTYNRYTNLYTYTTKHLHTHIHMHTYTHISIYTYTGMQTHTHTTLTLALFFQGLRGNHKLPSHQNGASGPWAMVCHEKDEFKGSTQFLELWSLPWEIIARPQFAFSGPWELLHSDRLVQLVVGQKWRFWSSMVPKCDPGQIRRAPKSYKCTRSTVALTFDFAGIKGIETE